MIHPALPIVILSRIHVQMHGGFPSREESEEGSYRGDILYDDILDWEWDPIPAMRYRYSARILKSEIEEHPSRYKVLDTLVIIPKFGVNGDEVRQLVNELRGLEGPVDPVSYLSASQLVERFFVSTQWNWEMRK